jgi:hypothetical protein
MDGGGGSGTRFIGTALGGGGKGTRFIGTAAITPGGGGNGTRFIGTAANTPGGGGGSGTGFIGTAAINDGGGGSGTRFIGTAALAVQAAATIKATRTTLNIPTERVLIMLISPGALLGANSFTAADVEYPKGGIVATIKVLLQKFSFDSNENAFHKVTN